MAADSDTGLKPDAEMAEVLRAWDDEDDEMVEFIQNAETRPDLDETHRRRAENGSPLHDVEIRQDGRATLKPMKESSTLTGKPLYMPYIRGIKTACLFVSFFGLGIYAAIFGPSLLDLAYHTQSKVEYMSYVFTSRSIGYLLGSIVGGWLYDKYDGYLVLGCSCLGGTLGMIVFPLVGSIYALIIIASLMAIAVGALDTAGNALLFVLWPKKSRPYMQFLHFTFAIGAFVAPLLVKPFLLPDSINHNGTSTTSHNGIIPVTWAYWIGAIPLAMSGVVFLAFAFLKTCKEREVKRVERLLVASGQNGMMYRVVILTLFCLLLLQYVGLETVYGGFIFTFAVKAKGNTFTKGDAALITACYWGSFALARLASVPLSKYLKPPRMILCDLIGCLLAAIILISQFGDGCFEASSTKLWAGTIILGVSAASVFPATLNWAEYFLDVSGRTASILLVGSCVGDMVVPVAVGSTLESIGPCSLMYCVFALSVCALMTFCAIILFAQHYRSLGVSSGMEFSDSNKDDFEEPLKPKQQDDDEVLRLLEQNNEIFSNGNSTVS